MKHCERRVDSESPESVLALALAYANTGKCAKACETFQKVPSALLDPHRERFACLLLDNEQADLAREQIDLCTGSIKLHRTAKLYTLALIEYIASHHLEESSEEEAEAALRAAFDLNPFVAEAIGWDSFDPILEDDDAIEKLPSVEKMSAPECALAYLICWGQLELWQDSGAYEWLLDVIWGEELPQLEEPSGRLSEAWMTARIRSNHDWEEAQG